MKGTAIAKDNLNWLAKIIKQHIRTLLLEGTTIALALSIVSGMGEGLKRPCLIALARTGFSDAWTKIKASAPCVEALQVDCIQGLCSPGS